MEQHNEMPYYGRWEIPADLTERVGAEFDELAWRMPSSFSPCSFDELFLPQKPFADKENGPHANDVEQDSGGPLPFPLEPAFTVAALVFSGDATSKEEKERANAAAIRAVARALICIMYPGGASGGGFNNEEEEAKIHTEVERG